LGKRILGYKGIIQSFDVSPADAAIDLAGRKATADFAARGAKLLGLDETFTADDVPVTADYAGSAYGVPTDAGLDAMLLLGRTEGILVGPIYTAKGLSGMLDWFRAGKLPAGGTSVFIHTGGTPETFAYNREIMERINATA
jgi:1-aminocyclopropane-1-carboxylate deaminase/D-cysteine desulfhydrase-like pyridoxal-dependent ACC family enzyme